MKRPFDKIPRFTRSPAYSVNVSLSFLKSWVEEQLELGLEMQPDFQRIHIWSEDKQIRFVEFLLKGGVTSRTFYFNNPHWSSDGKSQKPGDFVLVDGRNRLNALLRFLNNDLPIFDGAYLNDYDKPRSLLLRSEGITVCINDLKTKKEVLQWYLDLNAGGVVHSDEDLNKVRVMLKDAN